MSKYMRVERERRFLVSALPPDLGRGYEIRDRYLRDLRLRVRRMESPEGPVFKLTQKRRRTDTDSLITTIYLEEDEYRHLSSLPGWDLRKTRHRIVHSGRVWAVDIFQDALAGLALAEIEFEDAEPIVPPPFAGDEVTADPGYTGYALARYGWARADRGSV